MFNLDINLDDETKEKLRKKIEHKIDRCNSNIEHLNSKKDNLSPHGYWDLGYFEGRKSVFEDLLDELLDISEDVGQVEQVEQVEVVYFELNNWFADRDYPAVEPFLSWLKGDFKIRLNNEEWVKENKLCILKNYVDMSQNFCITATKDWVLKNCPTLLTEHKRFLRFPDEDGDVIGRFGHTFLEYEECNFGITYMDVED